MSKHRAEARPRWGRIGLLAAAAMVTLVAVLAGFGVFSSSPGTTVARDQAAASASLRRTVPATTPTASASASSSGSATAPTSPTASSSAPATAGSAATTALPAGSGSGKRAVFSQTEQRVWIVDSSNKIERTYLVSGSDENNLVPGTYHVYAKSRWAVGIDDSGVMQYFVRFAHGTDNGAAIGFHTIPTKGGKPLQTVAQLGQRLSHGCIRQKTSDAIAMWDFAAVGTKVVVVA